MTYKLKKSLRVLNKYFALETGEIEGKSCTPQIVANPFEMCKQYVIFMALRGDSMKLPYLGYNVVFYYSDDYPDLLKWFEALSFQNSPSKINYRSNPNKFRELVEKLDFSKPYDSKVISEIQKLFIVTGSKKDISSDEIVEAELTQE